MGVLAALASVLLSPLAMPQQCDGDPGWVLDMPDLSEINTTVTIAMTGPANEVGLFMASLGEGPVESVYGTVCLDFPLLLALPFLFDGVGSATLTADVPCEFDAIGTRIFAQFITCKPNRGISNQDETKIVDGICTGDFATFLQTDFGKECNKQNAACRLEDAFDALFPGGIVIGDQDGPGDGDEEFALKFTSAAAVIKFLPQNGTAALLDADATDPTSSSAGVFAAELLVAKINAALDLAGEYDDLKQRDERKILNLFFASGVNPDIFGIQVIDYLDIADLAISGALGDGFDLDFNGDGNEDATLSDLAEALAVLNENFQNGTVNQQNMRIR